MPLTKEGLLILENLNILLRKELHLLSDYYRNMEENNSEGKRELKLKKQKRKRTLKTGRPPEAREKDKDVTFDQRPNHDPSESNL